MKIAVVSRSWFTELKGGAERYVYEVTKELIRRGHSITTVSRNTSDLPNYHIKIRSGQIPFISSTLTSILSGVLVELGEYDIVIVNGYWAEFASLFLKRRHVVIIHDVGLFTSHWAQRNRVKHFLRTALLGQVVKKASKIVVPSRLTYRDIQTCMNVKKANLEIVPEGIDLSLFRPGRMASSAYRISQWGRFAPNKGQDLLLEAFGRTHKRYPLSQLVLAGHVSRDQATYYSHLSQKAAGQSGVVLKKNPSDRELRDLCRHTDLAVFPSTGEEGWGIAVTEAFACQIPVICSTIFYKTGVADKSRALISKPEPNELSERILWAIEHPSDMDKLALEGFKFVQGLAWKNTADRIIQAAS